MKTLFILLFALFLLNKINAQCTYTPVKETVINGGFELGNIPVAQAGFSTSYYQNASACTNSSCWSTSNEFIIGKTTNDLCYSCNAMNPQTTPHSGNYAMYIDGAGLAITIWQETVKVFPNQTYYFSAWVALLDQTAPPILQFYVNGKPLGIATDLSVNEPANGVWTQMTAQWSSDTATSAIISFQESKNNLGTSNGDDYAVDDISFINSTQYNSSAIIPNLGKDTSICSTNGVITLNSNVTASGNGSFSWYEGTTSPQTILVNASPTQNTYTINSPGTYRVCYDDGNGKSASSTIIISDIMNPKLTDEVLCSPAIVTLNASVIGSQISYTWSVPSGATNPGNSPVAYANITGAYTVTVTGISGNGWGCVGKATSNVTSTLPTYDASKIASPFCRNTNATISGLGIGIDTANYKWYSAAATGGNVLGTGASPSFTFPGSGSSYTVYVVDMATSPLAGSPLIIQSLSAYGASDNTGIYFTIHKTIQLQTVTVRQQTFSGGCMTSGSIPVVVNLLQGSTIINSTNATINCGSDSQVSLNFTIAPGNYQLQVKGGTGNTSPTFASTNYSFTASSIPGWIDITGSNNAGYNGPFSKINVVKSNSCDLIPVNIPLKKCCTCPPPLAPDSVSVCQNSELKIKVNPNGANSPTFYWNGPNGFTASTSDSTLNVSSNTASNMQGKYYVYSISADTCQSVNDSVFINVKQLPATPVITQKNDYLVSDAPNGNQWYSKLSGKIDNATNATYTPSNSGEYYVIVTQNGCNSDTSNIFNFISVGVSNFSNSETNINIYPNPASDKFTISFDNQNESYILEIFNTIGQVVLNKKITNNIELIDLTGQPEGVYFVKLQSTNNTIVKKIIKE